jgi:hypothetical protein
VIEQIQCEPHIWGKICLEPVAWDQPGAGTVMRATISPQEAIAEGLPTPAECDIVIGILPRLAIPLSPSSSLDGLATSCSGAHLDNRIRQ